MRLQLQGQTARLAGPGFISSVPLHLKKTGGKCRVLSHSRDEKPTVSVAAE